MENFRGSLRSPERANGLGGGGDAPPSVKIFWIRAWREVREGGPALQIAPGPAQGKSGAGPKNILRDITGYACMSDLRRENMALETVSM